MKSVLTMCFATLLLLSAAGWAGDTEEAGWLDLESCGFCKHLTEDPGLLDHCTWENHNVEKGVVTVTTVEKDYMPSYHTAMVKMKEVNKKMEAGEMVPMCGSCAAMGGLMMKGAKMEHVETQHGYVMLMTSDDPELVTEIHAWTDKTNAELAKFEEATPAEEK